MDDDYDYQQTRKEYRWRVGLGIAGAILGVGLLVVRYAARRDRERDYSIPQQVYVPSPTPAALPIARDPVEFELVVGADHYDVIPDKIVDVKGGPQLTFEYNPTQLARGDGYHFMHRNTVSVSATEQMVIASVDGNVLKLQAMDAKAGDAANKATLNEAITITGQARGKPVPVARKIAGKSREGLVHHTTTQMDVEVFLVPLGKTKLGVLLYRQDPRADLSKIDALLESIAEGPGEPTAEFTLRGDTTTPIFLDKPFEIAKGTQATLRRRATVVRTMTGNGGSLTFEHPRGMTVSKMPNDQMLAVTLQTDRAAIQLFDLQMRFTLDELKSALLGAMDAQDLGPVTHTLGGQSVSGRKLHLAAMPVEHELFVFERGGKTIGASIQYIASDEKAAIDTALPILLSVK